MYVIIDLETGTIIGTHVVVLKVEDSEIFESMSTQEIIEYGEKHGTPLPKIV